MKTLTISIAAYNVASYLDRCLGSIARCDALNDTEILIENDGSTDNTAEIGEKYVSQYPDSFRLINKENGGYGSTINHSIEIATGKYFKQLDGDDWYDPDELSGFVNKLKTIDSDYVVSLYTTRYEDSDKKEIVDPCENVKEGTYAFADVPFAKDIPMHCLCFKTKVLKNMKQRLDTHCLYTDVELDIYPVALSETITITKNNVYQYMMGREGQSVNRKSIEKHLADHKKVMDHVIACYNAIPGDKTGQRKYVQAHLVKQMELGLRYICMADKSKENRERLKEFIIDMRTTCPDVYQLLLDSSRFSRIADKGNGLFYSILRKRAWTD